MAKSLHKERDNRSPVKKDLHFHPYTVTLENVNTSLLLLKSAEPDILCQTLHALTKFAAQDMTNREVLFDRDAIASILPHMVHNEFNVQRFALKGLAQLCQLPAGPERVLKDPVNVKNLALIYVKFEDVVVLEFASLVLAELTREPLGCEQVISANIVDNLFTRIKNSVDPDVQKNSLQVISNLLDHPACASEVTKSPRFSWGPLLLMLQNKYIAIQQTTLHIIDKLLCRYEDQSVQKSFRATTGILDFFDVIESYEFRDLHTTVLNVLRTYVASEENALFMHTKGCTIRLLTYFERTIPGNKPACLAVLARMSLTANGREVLMQTRTDKLFCLLLSGSDATLWEDAALGVANMTQLMSSAVAMADTAVVESLCAIAVNESVDWFYVRVNALRALAALCRLVPKAAASAVQPAAFGSLRSITKRCKDTPIEAERWSLQCYKNLLNHEVAQNVMLRRDFVEEIISVLYRKDITLRILACDVLAELTSLEGGRELFTELGGEKAVAAGLKVKHVGLRTAFCNLMIASVSPVGADLYLRLGTIDYMVEERQARYAVGAWEPALEALFRRHASAKFAYTGRLDIGDYTQDGFYVQKRLVKTLTPLAELLQRSGPPRGPVYVANFHTACTSGSPVVVPDDENLRSYILRLRLRLDDKLTSAETCPTGCNLNYGLQKSTREKAQILGEFVAQQLSGVTRDRDCSAVAVDLHVSKLMAELNSEVISIGHLRVGGPLERAILYKTLADRIALPCALRRACSAKAWCEVAVPEPEPVTAGVETLSVNKAGVFPAAFLRANYVVDLMETPGRMHKVGSHQAEALCGASLPPYTVKTITDNVYAG